MAGIDNLAAVMGRDADMDHVERDRLCDEAAAEIERLRAALAAETEECARVAEDFEAQVRNKITKTVDMHGDFGAIYVGAIYASKRIAAAIRARGR